MSRPGLKERSRSAPMVTSILREDRNDGQRRELHPTTSELATSAGIDLDDGQPCLYLPSDPLEPSKMIQVPSTSGVVS